MLEGLCSFICSTCCFLGLLLPVLNSCGTSLLASLTAPWGLSHLECAVCQIPFIFSTRNWWSCFCCFFPRVPLRHFVLLCQRPRGSDYSLEGSYSHLRAAACFLRMHYLFLFLGVLVFCLGSGHSPNLCRNPILKLVQLLT